jgi:site-specific DNA-methyltransferase (adenine-specific)
MPFLALRSYLPADHPNKTQEMGSEPTPGEFIDGLLDIVEELRRVLAPHGSLCFELGDTYSGSGGENHLYEGSNPDGGFNGSAGFGTITTPKRAKSGYPLDKSLCLIPESFRWALAYGHNPFTGRTIQPWRVRNVIRWHRPNPSVGALGDKFRCSTSDMVVACISRTRYFDLDAVRTEAIDQRTRTTNGPKGLAADAAQVQTGNYTHRVSSNPAGAPPLDTWIIPTQPYRGAHYATFPEALCIRPIKAMCPASVCRTCGQPRRRIVETLSQSYRSNAPDHQDAVVLGPGPTGERHGERSTVNQTIGWSDCGHNNWRAGVVLDPFAGSGTTGLVATGHGRDFIGIDLDETNAQLAIDRIGPLYLTVEHHTPQEAT